MFVVNFQGVRAGYLAFPYILDVLLKSILLYGYSEKSQKNLLRVGVADMDVVLYPQQMYDD